MGQQVQTFRIGDAGLESIELTGESLDEITRQLPNGAYTTMRTYEGDRFLRMEEHFRRIESSAGMLGHPLHLDRAHLREVLDHLVHKVGHADSRLRIIFPLEEEKIYVLVEPFTPLDPALYQVGAKVITVPMRRSDPRAKTTAFIRPSRQMYESLPPGVEEVLMIHGRGEILEGFSSNFFALKGETIYTAEEGVLEGITRGIVIDLARKMLSLVLQPVRYAEIPQLSECFITSVSREVMPVVQIDDHEIGDGRPGPVAVKLREQYRAWVSEEAEPAVE